MGQVTDTKIHVPQSHHQQVFDVVDDGRLKRTGNLTTNSMCAKNHNLILVSRGIHEDSRMRIIHRDLNASNDQDMKPKISDFGFWNGEVVRQGPTLAETERVVGTFMYMAPEYYNNGTFSVKSDVYSFRGAGPGDLKWEKAQQWRRTLKFCLGKP